MNTLIMVILGILSLSLLIIIHEFGHLLIGLWLKAQPKTFAIGFGKSLWSKQIKGINVTINSIPLGGYVDFNTTQFPQIEKEKKAISFWKWILIAFAGPLFNFLTSWILLLVIIFPMVSGMEVYQYPSLTNKKIIKLENISDLDKSNFKEFSFLIKKQIFLDKKSFKDIDLALLQKTSFSFLETSTYSIKKSTDSFFFIATQYFNGITQLFKKSEYSELSGPIGIITQFKNHSKSVTESLSFICLLSFAIGFFNLLPFFTILDGGRIVIAILQTILGDKPIINKITIQMNSFSLVIFFMIFVYTTIGDILKLF